MKTLFFFLIFIETTVAAQIRFDSTWIAQNLQEINSKKNDIQPFVVDDTTLIVTSDRSGKSKAYFSTWRKGKHTIKKQNYKWTLLNASTTLVGTNQTHFFFRKNNDLYWAERKENHDKIWKIHRIKKLKQLNSDAEEQSVTCINDIFYFSSNRNGNFDLFMKINLEDNSQIVALDALNSPYDEVDIFVSDDGSSLFFSSNRPGGLGGFDIYQSNRIAGEWSNPFLLTPPINSPMDDRDFRIYADSTVLFSSDRYQSQTTGGFEIYTLGQTFPLYSPPEDSITADSEYDIQDTIPIAPVDSLAPVLLPIQPVSPSEHHIPTITSEEENLPTSVSPTIFRAEIQIGAYRYIKSITDLKKRLPCLANDSLRMIVDTSGQVPVYKFVLDEIFTNLDEATQRQKDIMTRVCLPNKKKSDLAFIALLDQHNERYGLVFDKNSYLQGKVIYLPGKKS